MLRRASVLKYALSSLARQFSTTKMNRKRVCLMGSYGKVGQTLSVLLKREDRITSLTLYDIKGAIGQALDVGHIDTQALVAGFEKPEDLPKALYCADIVIIVAGSPRQKDSKEDDLLKTNSKIISELIPAIAQTSPTALIVIVTSPVNALVPMAAEILKAANAYDPKRLFGFMTSHVVRSRTFVDDMLQCDPVRVNIPVIGGNSTCTVLPILSDTKPIVKIEDEDDIIPFLRRVREAEDAVLKARKEQGSLMAAHAVAKFTHSLLMGLSSVGDPVECAYVESKAVKEVAFFSTQLKLGPEGIKENLGLPNMHQVEIDLMNEMFKELQESIKKGIALGKKK